MSAIKPIDPSLRAAAAALTDAELASSAVAGSVVSFETLVRRHNRLLFRTARGVVPHDAEAQDVVQETWLRVFVKLDTYRGEAALGTWLARMAINIAISSQRRKGRHVPLQDNHPAEGATEMYNLTAGEGPDASAERTRQELVQQP